MEKQTHIFSMGDRTGDMDEERHTFVLSVISNAIAEAAKQRPRPRRITGDAPKVI